MDTSLKQLKITRENSAYWRVTFDNPPINLLDAATVPELLNLIELMESDPDLRVIVFDSANPEFFIAHFSASAGLDTIVTPRPNGLYPWVDFVDRLSRVPVVTVAAIRGRARGVGAEFALSCDIRFGSREKAILAQIEVGVGLFPGGGALERLPRLVGRGRALEVILGADDFDAVTAEMYGWLNRAVPDAEFEGFVDAFARRIASFDKQALSEAKRLLNAHYDEPSSASVNESQQAFFGAYRWPGAATRAPKLAALGVGRYSDLELNFGRYLSQLNDGASAK
ncbi:enoyl-CoA hydratase/isomerase family protein [Rhodanobacter sp. MP7CTX1]|uniref:enoyl-CoA hydratase/isomerase family protein n=1 Tax=Rhodanobacter sp. MP7CTX1 TaxID=2723084 RepID=UPI0016216602|nr:enoyl-CoA hydratase/isomerase family protein [Rhodanobacter sp. MP7CTX1]MBB6186650.1 enoyl-CoA hydratase/carnithine racemase [Rhodanobacter sp. MP7CTX1]